jgi:hypothetical protein
MAIEEHDMDRWRGEVTAKLDMLGEMMKDIRERSDHLSDMVCRQPCRVNGVCERVGKMEEAHRQTLVDVADLKATARAWGAITGVVSGIIASVIAKLWDH